MNIQPLHIKLAQSLADEKQKLQDDIDNKPDENYIHSPIIIKGNLYDNETEIKNYLKLTIILPYLLNGVYRYVNQHDNYIYQCVCAKCLDTLVEYQYFLTRPENRNFKISNDDAIDQTEFVKIYKSWSFLDCENYNTFESYDWYTGHTIDCKKSELDRIKKLQLILAKKNLERSIK